MLKTPYVHAGRSETTGVDCVGFLTCVAKRLKYPYEDVAEGYSIHADGSMLNIMGKSLDRKKPGALAFPGDIGVFWTDPATKLAQHAGIFTERMGLIHIDIHVGRVVEVSNARFWMLRLLATYQLRGIE